jgi:hypothetical protein
MTAAGGAVVRHVDETIARELLGNQTLRKALDEFAAELSLDIYQHIDRSIAPL